MIHKAKVENCKIYFDHPKLLSEELKKLNNQEISVSIKKWQNERTIQQNSFYWLYLNLIEKETGQDANTTHEYCKRIFLEPKNLKFQDKEFKVPASTTNLKTKEFSDYIKKIEELTGVMVPDTKHLEQLDEYLKL